MHVVNQWLVNGHLRIFALTESNAPYWSSKRVWSVLAWLVSSTVLPRPDWSVIRAGCGQLRAAMWSVRDSRLVSSWNLFSGVQKTDKTASNILLV